MAALELTPEALRSRRQALDLSQAHLASILGVAANTLARWERAERRIGQARRVVRTLQRLEAQHQSRRPRRTEAAAGELPVHRLRQQTSSFVGRERDIASITQLLARARMVTVTGTGGMGKTRLALRIGAEIASTFSDGVYLVELAGISDPSLVVRSAAVALGVQEKRDRALADSIADSLRGRRVLLVLDNCEHLIQACAELAELLLTSTTDLHILATSREGLGIGAETIWPLAPLDVPDHLTSDPQEILDHSAIRLFVERAAGQSSSFLLTSENVVSVVEICRRLDGLPLALELAAARIPSIGVDQLRSRLADRFELLTRSSRLAPPRQQTLRAAVEWSYELLPEPERILFDQVSVFAGGWTLEAAESVCQVASDAVSESVIDGLGALIGKSLVVAEGFEGGQVRYRQLETLRGYGAERLKVRRQETAARRRHAAYFLGLAESTDHRLLGPHGSDLMRRLEADHDNLRAALDWFIRDGDVVGAERMCAGLWEFWYFRGYLVEGEQWVARVLQMAGDTVETVEHARLLFGAGMIAYYRSDPAVSEAMTRRALDHARRLDPPQPALVAWALSHLGNLLRVRRDFAGARTALEEGIAIAGSSGNFIEEAQALVQLGRVVYLEGDLDLAWTRFEDALAKSTRIEYGQGIFQSQRGLGEIAYQRRHYATARSLLEQSYARARALRDRWRTAWVGMPLGNVLTDQGDFDAARVVWTDTVETWRDLGDMLQLAGAIEGLGHLAASGGLPRVAMRLAGAAAALLRSRNLQPLPDTGVWLQCWLPSVRAKLGESAANRAFAEGQALSVDAALALTSDLDLASTRPADAETVLSARERSVAELVAQGLTDGAIARKLTISEHTAHTHVRHILAKLGLRSRAQIAAWFVAAQFASREHE